MNTSRRRFLLLPVAGLSLTLLACAGAPLPENPVDAGPVPKRGFITDLAEFDAFVATHPSAEEFRKHYPDVTLVMPWDIATKELRMNKSRYFAQVDEKGRVTGGQFQ